MRSSKPGRILKVLSIPLRRARRSYDWQARYRELFENAPDGIILYDPRGNILAANLAARKLTGFDQEELCHQQMGQLLSEESRPGVEGAERAILAGVAEENPIEAKLLNKEGKEIFVRLSLAAVSGEGEGPVIQCSARDVSLENQLQENLQYYFQQATRAQEEERKRISMELHDQTLQELFSLLRQLDVLKTKGQEISSENRARLQKAHQQVRSIAESLRRLSQDLRPAMLDRLGLLSALGLLASEITKNSGAAASVRVEGTEVKLPEEVQLMLFRVAQEAVNNAWHHARATKIEIKLRFSEKAVGLAVEDNGSGFDLEGVKSKIGPYGKLGILGMQERARLINGKLKIESSPGKGTKVVVEAAL
jgi:two-component system, NarL family, sensor histidine kinase DegS